MIPTGILPNTNTLKYGVRFFSFFKIIHAFVKYSNDLEMFKAEKRLFNTDKHSVKHFIIYVEREGEGLYLNVLKFLTK